MSLNMNIRRILFYVEISMSDLCSLPDGISSGPENISVPPVILYFLFLSLFDTFRTLYRKILFILSLSPISAPLTHPLPHHISHTLFFHP